MGVFMVPLKFYISYKLERKFNFFVKFYTKNFQRFQLTKTIADVKEAHSEPSQTSKMVKNG